MIVLAFDAGGGRVRAALARGEVILAERSEPRDDERGDLLALVAATLETAGVAPASLRGIVALAGPGSFTGTRVACATALGLAAATGARATGVSTLEALALAAPNGHGGVLAVVDALRGEWYVQRFARDGEGAPRPAGEPAIALPASVDLTGVELVVGDDAPRFAATAAAIVPASEPSGLCAAVARAAASGRWQWDPARLSHPLYLRAPATTGAAKPPR